MKAVLIEGYMEKGVFATPFSHAGKSGAEFASLCAGTSGNLRHHLHTTQKIYGEQRTANFRRCKNGVS